MEENNTTPKWGFGMNPISPRMRVRYDNAVQVALGFMDGFLACDEVDPDAISELKGMFNRCLRKDQVDWFTVLTELGTPPRHNMQMIVAALIELRQAVKAQDSALFEMARRKLVNSNLLLYLYEYQTNLSRYANSPSTGWIYILYKREQPDVVVIGVSQTEIAEQVKALNDTIGKEVPFAARQVFKVKDAIQAEKEIFEMFSDTRVSPDQNIFRIPYREAAFLIGKYVKDTNQRQRQVGVINWFIPEKGYGFISHPELGDIFVHSGQIQDQLLSEIVAGANVEFDLGRNTKGLVALNVQLVDGWSGKPDGCDAFE